MSYLDEYYERRKKKKEETGFASYYEGYIDRQIKRGRINLEDEVSRLNNDIQNYWNGHSQYLSGYNDRFSGENTGYRADSREYLDSVKAQSKSLKAQGMDISKRLDLYGKYLDPEWMKSVKSMLGNGYGAYDNIIRFADRDNQHWSRYANEDEYNIYTLIADGKYDEAEALLKKQPEGSSQEYWDILNFYKNEKAYKENNADYLALMGNEDFAKNSKYKTTKTGEREIDWLATLGTNLANAVLDAQQGSKTVYKEGQGYGDITYDIINGNPEAKLYADQYNLDNYGAYAVASGLASVDYLTQLTEDEKKIFNYLYATEGKERAYGYISHLENNYLNERNRAAVEAQWAQLAQEAPVLSSIISIGTAPVRGGAFLSQAIDYLDDGKIQDNARYNQILYANSAIRNQVSKDIEASGKWGKVGSFAYDVGMSMGDFLYSSAAGLGNGIAAGLIMGTSAAADTTLQGIDRGLDSTRAIIMGSIAGTTEFFTERMGLDNLLDAALAGKSKFAYFLKNALSEGAEEGVTDLINWAADDLYDLISGQDKSEWKAAVAEYIAKGYTEAEAFGMALGDRTEQLATDVLAGAASGGIMGGAGAIVQAGREYKAGAQYKADPSGIIGDALALNPNSEYAQKLQGKLDAGKKVGQGALGKLSFEMQDEVNTKLAEKDAVQNETKRAEFEAKARAALSGKVHDKQELSRMVDTLTKINAGETVSNAELRRIANNQNALNFLEKNVLGVRHKAGEVTVKDLRKEISSKQDSATRLSSENILATASAFFNMDEVGERSLMVSYATDLRNSEDGKIADPEVYAAAYNRVYSAGKKGADVSKIIGNVSSILSDSAIAQAYRAGQNAAGYKNSQQGLQNGSQSGTISTENMEAQNEQELHLRDSGERNDSKNSRGQVSAVEGNARQNKGRGEGRTGPRDSEASSLSYDREVSAQELVKGGLESSKVWLPTEGSEIESMKEARKIAESRGLKIVFFGGGNLKVLKGSKIISARAYIQGDTVYVRVDHAGFAADQLMLHEAAHDMIDKGEIDVEAVRKLIGERFTPEEIDAIKNAYAIAYEGAGMTADEIWVEIICDSVAEMNSFEGTDFTAAAEMAADFLPDLKEAVLESKKESRGPPAGNVEGKASRETRRAKYINVSPATHSAIHLQLRSLYGNAKSGVATEIAVPVGNSVFIVDSGMENGTIDFAVRKQRIISDQQYKYEYIKERNDDALSKGFVSEELSSRFRSWVGRNSGRDMRRELRTELSTDQGKSADNQKGISDKNADNRGLKGHASIDLASMDADYMSAVESGDMETAQKMVDEAAKKAGYTDKLYHGTKQFGFTVFDPMKSDDGISLFAAGSYELAQTYSGVFGSKKISDAVNIEGLTDKEVVERLNETAQETYEDREMKSEYQIIRLNDVNKLIGEVNEGVEALADAVETKINEYAERMAKDFNDSDAKVHRKLVELLDILEHYKYDDMSTPIYVLMHHTNAIDSNPEVADLEYKIRLMNKLKKVDTTNGIVVKKNLDGYDIELLTFDKARAELEGRNKSGNYSLYGKPKNQLVIDGKGQPWNDLKDWTSSLHYKKENTYVEKKDGYYRLYNKKTGEHILHGRIEINEVNDKTPLDQMHFIMVQKANNSLAIRSEHKKTTRDIAQFAKELGYDSIKFENIEDNGGRGESVSAGDVYVYFDPNNLKSADPVTYDDNGNVIPLSERFNSENADIRFSLDLNEMAEDTESKTETRELSSREILANMLESVAETDRDKSMLNRYKDHLSKIENNRAEIERLKEESKKAEKAKQKKAISQKIEKLQGEIDYSEKRLITLEDTTTLKYLVSKERKARQAEAHLAGQMAQGRRDAEILRHANEKLAEQKTSYNERLAEQKKSAREALEEQAKRYQESRAKSVEGRRKTDMKHKIQRVVAELDTLLRKGNKKSNVKLGLQDAVAASLEAFDINSEKTARYAKEIASLDAKIAAATDPDVIAGLIDRREKKRRNSEVLADKLTAMKQAYEDIHNNNDEGENYPAYYRAEAKTIMDRISDTLAKVGDTPISEMSSAQLQSVYDMYRMVLTTVRDANTAFIDGKLEDLTENAVAMENDLNKIKKLPEERLRAGDNARGFVWNELTPYYAFKRIGSQTLMRYYDELVRGQDVYARDLDEAKQFAEDARKKYKANKWNRNEIKTFKDKDGRTFRLNLEQMMSIYAYSKREQALDHMERGGFFYNNKETFRKDKKTGILEFIASNESGYKVNSAVLAKIAATLTTEQRAYVDEMQAYLTAMGEKGNEVSRQMWGIDIFKEKVYFPLKSKEDFIYQANTPAETSSLKNDGMTKETKPHASNPIVLESFDEVWANHVEKMSKYHGFVIPIDNLNKIINYGSWIDGEAQSISTMLEARYSSAVNDYLNTFIKDLNGAKAQNGGLLGVMSNWLTKFKKTAVAASLSVVVQQPTAILRAASEIDPKYFAHLPKVETLNKKWEKIKKYAPVAIIKDIGGFDAGSGRQITEWLNADTRQGIDKAMNKVDDLTMYGAALGDQIGWGSIWTAVEREVQARQKLKYGTEEFYEACGKRFTDVIVKTQVYDSTLSRSGFMRGKDGLLKMATAFMGEPTLSVNMLADAVLQGKRGTMKKRQVVRTVAAVYTATIAASLIKSLIYALRDDDEDESYVEKYLQALGSNILIDALTINMIPILRDVISIFTGWEVERADMALVQDLYNSIMSLDSEEKSVYRKIEDFGGALAAFAGIPGKNLLRTGREIYNAINDAFDGIEGGDLGGAFVEGITGKEKSKSQTLYEALVGGEKERIAALRKNYKSDKEYKEAIRKALRDYDPRIKKAAQALYEGDLITRNEIMLEIMKEGVFDKETLDRAIDAEMQAIKNAEKAPSEDEGESDWTSVYSPSDIPSAFDYCSDQLALEIIAELTDIKVEEKVETAKSKADAQGKKFDEAAARQEAEEEVRTTLRSTLTKHYKPLYYSAYLKGDRKEMERIRNILITSKLYVYKTKKDVDDVLEEWVESYDED